MRPTTESPPGALARVAAPLRQELISQLRAAILAFEFEPGERLVERALCDRYGVSRTVVREALRQLEAEGLVTIVANRGPIVAVLTPEDAVALFEVRAELEALAAGMFAERATETEREELSAAVDAVEAAFATGDLHTALEAKDNFYGKLLAGAHNPVIGQLLTGLHARVQLLRGLSLRSSGRQPNTLKEVRAICDHAVGGSREEAAEAARYHVRRAQEAALNAMTS